MKKQGTNVLRKSAPIFTMALFMLMLSCILILVVLGSSVYGSIVKSRDSNSAKRAGLSYLTQRVRACEEKNAIQVANGPQGDALVLLELTEDTGCETRIYLYNGHLVEEYALSSSEFSPDNAQTIAKTARFNVQIQKGELLLITSEGAAYINMHVEEAFS